MTDISLHYGSGQAAIRIPKPNIAAVIRPRAAADSDFDNLALVEQAVGTGRADFSQAAGGRTVGVLMADGTRDVLLASIVPPLLRELTTAVKVLFFICTGTHTADTPENRDIIDMIRAEAKRAKIASFEMIVHDCREGDFLTAGTTGRGTPVRYHARLQEPDIFAAISDVKHHYFAGYSNPIKNFVPGLCAFETTERNHSWTMDDRSCAGVHPWHPTASRRDNPLAQDQLEAMTAVVQSRPVWGLVTISSGGAIHWADFGPAQVVTGRAIEKADAWNSVAVEPVRRMIVSPGGLPNDVDLYIAQRALELTASVVLDGGEILFVSACAKGVGSPRTKTQFYDKLIAPLESIGAADRRHYQLFSHKPWRFARLIRRVRRLWMYSQIPAGEIEKMHMVHCANPQAVVDTWLQHAPQEPILVVDGANKLLLRRKEQAKT